MRPETLLTVGKTQAHRKPISSTKPTSSKTNSIKNHFHQNHFHQKIQFHQNPVSSKTNFIETNFIKKNTNIKNSFIKIQFHPCGLKHQKTTSIKNHFHQTPFSSKIKLRVGTEPNKIGVAITMQSVFLSPAEAVRPPFGFQKPSRGASPAEGQRCST